MYVIKDEFYPFEEIFFYNSTDILTKKVRSGSGSDGAKKSRIHNTVHMFR
jgi:hypothetical protein